MPLKKERLNKFFEHLLSSETIVLVSPEDPDVDSCTSIIAFREYLYWQTKQWNIKVSIHLYAPNLPRPNRLFEPVLALCDPLKEISTKLPRDADLYIIFDYGSFARTRIKNGLKKSAYFVGFDHHPQTPGFPENGCEIIDPDAPSTTAFLLRFFERIGFPLTPDLATCLLCGLMADTGRLSNPLMCERKTSALKAYEAAAKLLRRGADFPAVLAASQPRMSLARFRAQKHGRKNILLDESTGLAFLAFSRDELLSWSASEQDIMSLFPSLHAIAEMRVAAVYHQKENGGWHCSLHPAGSGNLDLESIAQQFGGGGHRFASAFDSRKSPKVVFEELKGVLEKLP